MESRNCKRLAPKPEPEHLLEERFKHVVGDLLRPRPVDLVDFLGVRVVSVESSELALDITEQQKEVGTIAPVDHVLKKRVSWRVLYGNYILY